MKHQQPLLAIALLLATSLTTLGSPLFEDEQRNRLKALRTRSVERIHLTPLDRAYLDAYELLGFDRQCGQFFGGNTARQILDEFVIRLRTRRLNNSLIGLQMSGTFTITLVEPNEGVSYRLFERVEINSIGAFYRSKVSPADAFVPNVGSFRPNSREARALMLLHELAHLIRGRDGKWLIPDDGDSAALSSLNTLTLETRCGQQLRAL